MIIKIKGKFYYEGRSLEIHDLPKTKGWRKNTYRFKKHIEQLDIVARGKGVCSYTEFGDRYIIYNIEYDGRFLIKDLSTGGISFGHHKYQW